jgi:hypothetical protein
VSASAKLRRSANGVPKHEPHKRQRNDDSEYDQEVEVHSAAHRGELPAFAPGATETQRAGQVIVGTIAPLTIIEYAASR